MTPSRASIETVKGVSKGDSFLAAIRSRPELVAALGRQRQADQPAPLLGHEVDRLGRGELGRERQVALVLAVLVVAHDHHPPAADVLDRLLDRGERRGRAGNAHARTASQPLHVLGEHVHLDVDAVAPAARAPSVVRLERLGDQRDREAVVVERADGEAHAVQRDRPLQHDVAQQRRRGTRARAPARSPPRAARATVAVPSTCPCTMCPPRRSPARSGSSRLTREPARREPSAVRCERLVHRLRAEALGRDVGGGQADAVDGDRVALAELAGEPGRDAQRGPALVAFDRLDACRARASVP